MNSLILEYLWRDLCEKYTADQELITTTFADLQEHYTAKGRHYHTLTHIRTMLSSAISHEEMIRDKDAFLFAIFFHDIIYKATAKDNEEKSAEKAVKFLKKIEFWEDEIAEVERLILATKSHPLQNNTPDTDLLLDLDLEVLGAAPEVYQEYSNNIRKEYAIYPDLLYKPGRKKVLLHFLDMPFIYRTELFRDKLEAAARENLNNELATL
ncbi:hypothetical protein [Chitinophaga sp. Cy-1792]|uniref:HD domain-containing protein n=1 Tax=Chitinophaga sp. Cy-1792 TaxID=2608339 RepID=UPI00141E27E8|nr:hypothetical protein [Chitinophaga sp. Cy-1792]NIG53635.1 hypothetical protein [Chitinophaga sp. Cy-1792]